MVRQKARKTVENLYTGVPSPSDKINEKTDIGIHNTVISSKTSKRRNPVEKKDQKTLINEETALGRSKNTKNHFNEENEKDEDTEEFFGMIKKTVERAVEKSLQELIGRLFKEISLKLDELRERVSNNENALEKINAELVNKIIHYGEENSRHFRYLCMKSEYDKMFYQHQNVITSAPVDARPNSINSYPQHLAPSSQPLVQTIHQTKPTNKPQSSQHPTKFSSKPSKSSTLPLVCKCQNNGFTDFDCAQQSKLSVSSKSSDMGIREVKELLEQLQKFYDQHNPDKNEQPGLENNLLNAPDQDDSADGDEDDDESSDGMTSPSIEENIGAGGDS